MKEKILMVIAVVSLILSITAVALEVRYNITQIEPSKIVGTAWTSTNDGSKSGLDADNLDSLDSSQLLRNDVPGTINGDLYVNGIISYNSVTRYCTIPASSFVRVGGGEEYVNAGSMLTNQDPIFLGIDFEAPLNLPDGAKVNKIIFYYFHNDPLAEMHVNVYSAGVSVHYPIVETSLPKNSNYDSKFGLPYSEQRTYEKEVNITIDNNRNAYYVSLSLDPNDSGFDLMFSWVCFECTITNP